MSKRKLFTAEELVEFYSSYIREQAEKHFNAQSSRFDTQVATILATQGITEEYYNVEKTEEFIQQVNELYANKRIDKIANDMLLATANACDKEQTYLVKVYKSLNKIVLGREE